jgi:hypothetical protein
MPSNRKNKSDITLIYVHKSPFPRGGAGPDKQVMIDDTSREIDLRERLGRRSEASLNLSGAYVMI